MFKGFWCTFYDQRKLYVCHVIYRNVTFQTITRFIRLGSYSNTLVNPISVSKLRTFSKPVADISDDTKISLLPHIWSLSIKTGKSPFIRIRYTGCRY